MAQRARLVNTTRQVTTYQLYLYILPPPLILPQLSTEAYTIKELPGDQVDDVLFRDKYGLRTILLNRPKKLNSVTGSMVRKIVPRMIDWEGSDTANVIVLKGAGEKALCAGGDIAALAKYNQDGADGWKQSADYFALKYKLDHYIATYKKPYVAFMDGITMGGGVGLSIHAPLRIATEKTVFAMPETTIGFFPRRRRLLLLSANRLTGADVFYSGIATHYLHSSSLPKLEARLAELRFSDGDTPEQRIARINDTIEEFATGLPDDQPMTLAGETRRAIDRCFDKSNLDDIVAALKAETGRTKEWRKRQLATFAGALADRNPPFEREHQIASKFMQHPDFTEGVTALLFRKETPKWQPESLAAIDARDNVVKPLVEFDQHRKVGLFTDRTFSDYPHPQVGVPSEREIKDIVINNTLTPRELAYRVIASRGGRQGIATIVNEIITRKVLTDSTGKAKWLEDETSSSSKL
ncbi:hypothetical protein NLG97_g952 [Lecanicillium saksenae]|uniref:Uncharacterized protein n=1 Tax=Lecanicillium saksenae TaxID=468837 RepID=A0ACC1R541_9HYPO|nr:hypothetical protein NLG97_g952 [Lecanicillium saksenae]